MIIVAGYVMVEPAHRADYLAGCMDVVLQARRAEGCLDFALSADTADPRRVNIFELWASQAAVETFRAGGPSDQQGTAVISASVDEYDVDHRRTLVG